MAYIEVSVSFEITTFESIETKNIDTTSRRKASTKIIVILSSQTPESYQTIKTIAIDKWSSQAILVFTFQFDTIQSNWFMFGELTYAHT